MADTTFIDGTTKIVSSWLNDVNKQVYKVIDTSAATTTAITIDASENTTFVGDVKSKLFKFSSNTAPTWDTNSYIWFEGGFGTRYDGYAHKFDVGVARSTALTLDNAGNATYGGDVSLADNKWTKYGTSGDDLWVGHDGVHSYIWAQSAATGNIYFSNSAASSLTRIHNANSVGTDKASIVTGGATPNVSLYYDGASVLSTSATGVDLTAGQELTLDRTTDDDGFINFKATIGADATSAVSSFTTSAATTHHIQVLINGTPAWIAVSTTDPTA